MLKIGGVHGESNTGIHGRHLDAGSRITYVAGDRPAPDHPQGHLPGRQGPARGVRLHRHEARPRRRATPRRARWTAWTATTGPPTPSRCPTWPWTGASTRAGISRDLPFIQKKAVEVLKGDYTSQDGPPRRSPRPWRDYYKASYPDVYSEKRALVDAAGEAVKDAFLRNVSPEMKLTWGTHPNHIGHQDGGGCFRCHDGSHVAKDGKAIASDCDTCHVILAQDEKEPKILKDLGIQ